MEWFHSNVRATQRSLEQRPEILHAVDVDLSANVSLSFVNHVMHEAALQTVVISNRSVGVDRAPKLHVLENFILQGLPRHVRNNRSANLSKIPVKDSLHNRLACCCCRKSFLSSKPHAPRLVHVSHLAADKGFVGFYFAAAPADLRLIPLVRFHDFTDALKHEPCRRLRHAQSAAKFVRTDAVLG